MAAGATEAGPLSELGNMELFRDLLLLRSCCKIRLNVERKVLEKLKVCRRRIIASFRDGLNSMLCVFTMLAIFRSIEAKGSALTLSTPRPTLSCEDLIVSDQCLI